MTEGELETTIKQLIERRDATHEDSAAYRMAVRQLDFAALEAGHRK